MLIRSLDPLTPLRSGAGRCFHGGAFFEAIGALFDDLDRRHQVINADVLDAWFPPAPSVLETIARHFDWLARTSPPTNSEGLVQAIADARGLASENIVVGAGSSDLIFRAFRHWLGPHSRVLLLDPTYGEYAHVCEQVLGCAVERLPLNRADGYRLDLDLLHARLQSGRCDLAVIVNPNNPTGQHVSRPALQAFLEDITSATRIWIDEAYLEYVGADQSLERYAAQSPNVVICKSLSKVYALSGLRAAYLCGAPEVLAPLRKWTPPWIVSLPGQVAAVKALQEPAYYAERYRQTTFLRHRLIDGLHACQPHWELLDTAANFVLCQLPPGRSTAEAIVEKCRRRGVYVRDAAGMGTAMGRHALRIAVKDEVAQERLLDVIAGCA